VRTGRGVRAGLTAVQLRWMLLGLVLLFALPPVRHAAGRAWAVVRGVVRAQQEARARHARVAEYARRYGISFETAEAVEQAARAEGLDVELAFRLVRVESGFRADAVSHAGAVGMTQLMPVTAQDLQPGVTRADLMDRDTNLRLGFRYMGRLLRVYDGDRETALHAYNRGIGTVARIRARGGDPANGYARAVLGNTGASRVGTESGAAPAVPGEERLHELAPVPVPAGP
jgi:soluble lytic murein transglycosylase-like protein